MWWWTLGSIVIWVVNPEIRRFYDLFVGLQSVEILAPLPLLTLTPHVWSLTIGGGWKRLPHFLVVPAWIWVGGFGYALLTALLSGNVLPGTYEFITFIFPPGLGLWVAADKTPFALKYKRITTVVFTLATITSVYGIIQYIVAPFWDCNWLRSAIKVGATSFGQPLPFQIRVFSTLNDPLSFSFFLAVALLFVLPELSLRRPLLVAQVPFWFIAFGLTLVRTGWFMFAFGTVAYLLLSPLRIRLLTTFAATAALVVLIVGILPAAIGNDAILTTLTTRFATLSDLDEDESRQQRQALYDSTPELISSAPFGKGLGVLGGAARLGPGGTTVDFDSGYLGRTLEGGIPGLILYLIPQFLLLYAAIKIWMRARQTDDTRSQAIAGLAAAHIAAFTFLQFGHDGNGLPTLGFWLIESLSISSIPVETAVSRLRAQPA